MANKDSLRKLFYELNFRTLSSSLANLCNFFYIFLANLDINC